jgi:hypothetical protein
MKPVWPVAIGAAYRCGRGRKASTQFPDRHLSQLSIRNKNRYSFIACIAAKLVQSQS